MDARMLLTENTWCRVLSVGSRVEFCREQILRLGIHFLYLFELRDYRSYHSPKREATIVYIETRFGMPRLQCYVAN